MDGRRWPGCRLLDWFEVLPFRSGMLLLTSLVAVPALLVAGLLTLGGGSGGAPAPVPTGRSPIEAAVPPPPTFGAYVPPRHTKFSPSRVPPRSAPPVPRQQSTQRADHPTAAPTCPARLKRWQWVWRLCKQQPGS